MNKTWPAVFIILIITAGCGGPCYYDLYLVPEKGIGQKIIDKVLRIEDINSNEVYWTQRIAFRSSPYQVEYFTFKQWAERPGEMVKNSILLFYRSISAFRKIVEDYSTTKADILLKATIYSLEMEKVKGKWKAHMSMDMEFIHPEDEEVIVSHSFDRREPVRGRKPVHLAEKVSVILKEELIRAVKKLSKTL